MLQKLNFNELENISGGSWGGCLAGASVAGELAIQSGAVVYAPWLSIGGVVTGCALGYFG